MHSSNRLASTTAVANGALVKIKALTVARRFFDAAIPAALLMSTTAEAQRVADIGFESVGRGAPLTPAIPTKMRTERAELEAYPPAEIEGYPEEYWMVGPFTVLSSGPNGARAELRGGCAWNGATAEGIKPLEVDLFTSEDFYQDRALWS